MPSQGTSKKRGPTALTPQHKAALAKGRSESRIVKRYLEALDANRPRRGRKRTTDSIRKRLDKVETELATASPVKRLQLIQEKMDLQNELNSSEEPVDMSELESEFVAVAKAYAERKGISYAAFRQLGVPAATLQKAGISRSA